MKPTAEALSLAGDKFLGRSYEDMDCQAFVEATLREIGIRKDLAGSNAWFREMTWVGAPEECKARFGSIPKGAFLFIHAFDGKEPEKYRKDGRGNAKHIGIYVGRGDGAIHSSESRGGVCYSVFNGKSINGGWNRVGLWAQLSYGDKIDQELTGSQGGGGKSMMKALVTADQGKTVNMRANPSKDARVLAQIPIGELVDMIEEGSEWSSITYNGREGWMMSMFLVPVAGDPQESAPPEDIEQQTPGTPGTVTITLDSDLAYDLWCRLGNALGEDTMHG